MKTVIFYNVLLMIGSFLLYYLRAKDMNSWKLYNRDDTFLPPYQVKCIQKQYYIAKPMEKLPDSKKRQYQSTEWKKLGRMFRYDKPLKKIRVRAYLLEWLAQIFLLVDVILIAIGLIILFFVPDAFVFIKRVLGIYPIIIYSFPVLYEVGMDFYVDNLRQKEILGEESEK